MKRIWSVVAVVALALGAGACGSTETPADGGSAGGGGGGSGGGAGGGAGGGGGGNRAPAWIALETVVMDEGATRTLELSATDEDGDSVTFEITGGAAFATITGNQLVLSPLQTDEGDYLLQLSATDGKVAAAAELAVVVNRVNVAPVLQAVQDVVVAPGATASVTLVASDADNDPLTLSPSGLPAFAVLDGDTLTLSPDASILGDFAVSVSVSDGELASTQSFVIQVKAVQAPNLAPTVAAVQQLGLGSSPLSAGASLSVPPSLAATVTDPEGDDVALEAEVVAAGQPFTGTPSVVGTQAATSALAPLPLGALPAGDYSWRLRARDAAGNASAWQEFSPGATSFTLLPAAGSATGTVTINAGAAFTRSATVTLGLTQVTGTITQMAFSADGNFAAAAFVPFAPTASFTLPAGDGTRSVYARFQDGTGGTSDATDTIVLDTTAPSATVTVQGGAAYTRTAAVSVAVSPVEGGSGVDGICVKQESASATVSPLPQPGDPCFVAFVTPVSVTLGAEGDRRIVVHLKDKAGNTGQGSATIHYDATAPAMPGKFGASSGVRTVDFRCNRPSDSGSGLDGYELEWCNSLLPCTASNTRTVTGIAPSPLGALSGDSYALSAPNGRAVTARMIAVDKAGNRSAPTSWQPAVPHWPFVVTQRAPSANALHALAYLASTGTYFIAGSKGELYTSTAPASGYRRVDPMTDEDLLAVDTSSSYVWLAGSNGYIGRSDDQGVSFSPQAYATPVTVDLHGITYAGTGSSGALGNTTQAYVAVGEGGTIVRSTRACLSPLSCGLSAPGRFAPVTSGVTANLRAVTRCTGGPSHCSGSGVVIAVGASGTLLRSQDAGATWAKISPPSGYDTAVFNAVVQVPGTDTLYAGGTKPSGRPALVVSTAGGTVWDAVVSPSFDDYAEITALAAQPKTGSGASNALFVGGLVGTTPTVSHWVLSTSTRSNATVPTSPTSVVATGFAAGAWVGAEGTVQQSTALIKPSWAAVSSGSTSTFQDVRLADGSADAAIAVGSGGRILVTTNQGSDWTSVAPASAAGLQLNAAWFDGTSAVVVGKGGAILRGTGGGSIWGTQSAAGFTQDLQGVACRSSSACIAVGGKESILTYGGSSWAVTSTNAASTASYLAVTTYLSGATPRAVVVGAGGKVHTLQNTTWTQRTSGVTGNLSAVAARKSADGVVVAVGGSSGALLKTPVMVRSTDHGATWTSVPLTGVGGELTGIAHVEDNQWLATSGAGTVYLSTDDGLTWAAQVSVADSLLRAGGLSGIHCSSKSGSTGTCMAPGSAGGIYVTFTAGQ